MSVGVTARSSPACGRSCSSTASRSPPRCCRPTSRWSSSRSGGSWRARRPVSPRGAWTIRSAHELRACLDQMRTAESHEVLVQFDARFHSIIAGASGNATLASILSGVSSQTIRARVWRGDLDWQRRSPGRSNSMRTSSPRSPRATRCSRSRPRCSMSRRRRPGSATCSPTAEDDLRRGQPEHHELRKSQPTLPTGDLDHVSTIALTTREPESSQRQERLGQGRRASFGA